MSPETTRSTRPGVLRVGPLLRLAWRNLTRNRRRTWITAVTVAVAVLLLQLMSSLLIGIEQQSFDNLINYQTAHAKVYAEGYFDKREDLSLEYALDNLAPLETTIAGVDGVAGVTPRLTFSAQLSDGIDQVPCLGLGVDVQNSDTDVFRLPQAVVAGSYLAPDTEGLLLGSGLASFFEAQAGDWLTVLAKTQAGAYEALDLPVVGLVGTGNPYIDQNSFVLPLSTAQDMLDMAGQATELSIRFAPTAGETATLRRVDAALPSAVEVKGWREVEADLMALVEAKRSGRTVFLGIFIAIALVGITNTILMASFERTREVGTLLAMGLRRSGVRRLFLTEGALTGLLGGAVGTLLALVPILYFYTQGINLTALYGDMDLGYPVQDVIYPALSLVQLSTTWLLTGALAALAAYYPAARASRQDPAEALRYV